MLPDPNKVILGKFVSYLTIYCAFFSKTMTTFLELNEKKACHVGNLDNHMIKKPS